MSSSSEKSKNITGARLSLVRGFGAASLSRDSVFFLSNSKVAYMCGQRLVFHDITSGDMSFFKRSKSMPVVSSMALDGSRKVLALCEGGKERGGRALLSFYNTSTGARIKAITNNASNGNIVTCAFGPNGKEFVTVSEAPDCTLAVWQWSSSKCVQHVKIGSQVTRVRVNPLNSREFTTSGPEYLRMWRLEATSMKSTALVKPAKKEQEGNFLDHVWTKQKLLAVLSSERILVLKYNKDLQTCEPVFSIEFDEVYKDSRDFSSPKTISRYNKGFCVGGEKGSLAVYERSGDPKEPYVLIKTFRGHEYDTISCLATSPNNENVACMNTSGTINMFPLSFVDTLDDTKDNFFKDLVYRGIHRKEISSLDVSVSRPILVTCDTSDRQISIWNYLNWKCEFTKELPSDPTCVALHPSGFIVLVATKARVKLYNIGMTKLITMSDIPGIKHCKVARFSNGGQYFACSSGITNIVIYSTFQSQHLHTLVGHIAFVRGLDWSADDSKLYSVGADGGTYLSLSLSLFSLSIHTHTPTHLNHIIGVYGWRTSDGKRDSEMVVKNCRFTDVVTSRDGSTAAMVGDDGRMHYRVGDEYYSFECGDGLIVNSLVLPKCETYIVTGMSNGAIRVYPWPLPRMSNVMPGVISEIHLHSNAVTNLRISIDQKYLFSASKKGVLMVSAVKQMMSSQVEIPFEKPHRSHYNADTVVQLREDVEETKLNVIRLNNTIGDVMSKSKFQLQLMKTEWQDKLKDHIEESKQESSIQSGQYVLSFSPSLFLSTTHADMHTHKHTHSFVSFCTTYTAHT
jgi:cilia- and flagella-associated protein 57